MRRRVFYSFHYDNDCWRVQQIRNMGVFDGDNPVLPNPWEEIRRRGDYYIQRWIDNTLVNCSCLVVLVGSQTANRKWVQYEIQKAWEMGKGVLGIRIHNLENQCGQTDYRGRNPFEDFSVFNGITKVNLSSIVECFDPSSFGTYNDIYNNLPRLVELAIYKRQRHLY